MWHFVRTTAKAASTSQSLMLLYKKIRSLEIAQVHFSLIIHSVNCIII